MRNRLDASSAAQRLDGQPSDGGPAIPRVANPSEAPCHTQAPDGHASPVCQRAAGAIKSERGRAGPPNKEWKPSRSPPPREGAKPSITAVLLAPGRVSGGRDRPTPHY